MLLSLKYGNSGKLSIIKGIIFERTSFSKKSVTNIFCSRVNCFSFFRKTPFFFNSIWILLHILLNSFCCCRTIFNISFSTSVGLSSKWTDSFSFLLMNSVILFKVATLIRKNSSRLLEKIPKNRMRSFNGTLGSFAS